MSKNTRNRILLTALAALLLVVAAVGGTMAWLQADTDEVVNTFTPAAINVSLTETMKPDGTIVESGVTDWTAQLIPSKEYKKNPTVTVTAGEDNVASYLFVKVEGADEVKNYLDFTLFYEEGGDTRTWTPVTGHPGVYYTEIAANAATQTIELIKNNTVTVKDLTTATMASADVELTFQAYIIQQYGWESDIPGAYVRASNAE